MSLVTNRLLYSLASAHGGLFTTGEALAAGLTYRQMSHYVGTGVLERVTQGIYRLDQYPLHPHTDLIAVALWAGPGSAISHDSALAVYDLGQAMPAMIHVSVPGSFRGARPGVLVHRVGLPPAEVRIWDEVPVTSVERTLCDVAADADGFLAREATQEALARGLTTRARLGRAVSELSRDRTRVCRALGVRLPASGES
ncbi:MAG: hypothetical protein QG608_793 [Actinomycetota bacterium]|nr:hypothetical protein [Actinomycetota bacterium]